MSTVSIASTSARSLPANGSEEDRRANESGALGSSSGRVRLLDGEVEVAALPVTLKVIP